MCEPTEMLRRLVIPAVLAAAEPGAALAKAWALPEQPRRVVLAAFGKASPDMARAAVERLEGRIDRGLIVCRDEHLARAPKAGGRLQTLPADHPMPTPRNLLAANALAQLVASVTEEEQLVVLSSGGGSAQLAAPRKGLTLEHIAALTHSLLRSGATIDEINCVRKHCEAIKGGQLARLTGANTSARPPVEVFVLSDVLGDPLDVISSGPFAPDPTTFEDAIEIMDRRNLARDHGAVMALLEFGRCEATGDDGPVEETPKPGDPAFNRVRHHIIANNASAIEAAAVALRAAGCEVVELRNGVTGEAAQVGRALAARVRKLQPNQAVVWGGETTVTVGSSTGKGGRNQELALAAAIEIEGLDAAIMSLATDGIDGPTDAAGGIVDNGSAAAMKRAGIDVAAALRQHDSWTALRACGSLIEIGPTGTNVNDVMVGARSDA